MKFFFLPTVASFTARNLYGRTSRLTAIHSLSSSSMSSASNLVPSNDLKKLIKDARIVCFDVDSTVIQEEGIDELAAFKGKKEAVAELTANAMGGSMLFQDALAARLDIIQPSKGELEEFMSKAPLRLSGGMKDLVDLLHSKGVLVYLVSGGFRQMIEPIAEVLDIPFHRIYANNLLFNVDGSFAGFDKDEPTSRDGGKPAVIQLLLNSHGEKMARPILMVGDGATDMQAKPPADAFLGFGGVAKRQAVEKGADWFITDFEDLITVLKEDEKKD